MTPSNIEWLAGADGRPGYVWNPVTGCGNELPCYARCYARHMAETRLAGRCGYSAMPHSFDVTLHQDRLDNPRWPRKPAFVFVNSMGDLFHPDVPKKWIDDVFSAINHAPRYLIFIILTKRPERMYNMRDELPLGPSPSWARDRPCSNLWVGVSAENQDSLNKRILWLMKTPAAKRVVSIEPTISSVSFHARYSPGGIIGGVSWIICGPETGPGARPMNLDWARRLRDECRAADVPFWYKGGLLDGCVEHGRPE